jgi:hypothetical protein
MDRAEIAVTEMIYVFMIRFGVGKVLSKSNRRGAERLLFYDIDVLGQLLALQREALTGTCPGSSALRGKSFTFSFAGVWP